MPAGTITLTNNSNAVTGSGTSFTNELKPNDFIVVVVGGVTYTLGVQSINSDSSVTLNAAYNGPGSSSLAWTALPNQALVGISAQIAADTARAIRCLNYDKNNWQQVLTGEGEVTVNVPDGSQYTGPSWLSLANSLSGINTSLGGKANKSDLGDSASKNVGTFSGTVAAGDDKRFKYGAMNGGVVTYSSGSPVGTGDYSTAIIKLTYSDVDSYNVLLYGSGNNQAGFNAVIRAAWGDTIAYYQFNANGNAYSPSQWISNSDARIKTNIEIVSEPLIKLTRIRGVKWKRLDGYENGIGFVAQSVQKDFPEHVFTSGNRKLVDGTEIENVLSPDTSGVAAALHHESLLFLMSIQRKALLTLADSSMSEEERNLSLKELAALIPDESEYAKQ